mgnify:CR=1 FL=1
MLCLGGDGDADDEEGGEGLALLWPLCVDVTHNGALFICCAAVFRSVVRCVAVFRW